MPNYQVWKEEVFFEKFCLNFLYWNALLNTNIDDAATFAGLKVISKGEKKEIHMYLHIFSLTFPCKKNVVTNILIKVLMIKYTFNFQRTTTKIWINAYFCELIWRKILIFLFSVLDAFQDGWNTKRRSLLRLCWHRCDTIPLSWI